MVEQALQTLEEADTYAAIEFLNQQPDVTAVATAYYELTKALYWERKAIDQVVAMSRAGIQYCSDQAERAAAVDMELSRELRGRAKALAFNLASHTWPGWDVPGIELTPLHVQVGCDAARTNLRLALELDKGDLPLARAYWMLGAHLFTQGLQAGAAALFERAGYYAARAEAPAEALLFRGYAALAALREAPGDGEHLREYESILQELERGEYGAEFVDQLQTAERVTSGL
jgi:hypothetical protein